MDFKSALEQPFVRYSLVGVAVLGVGYIALRGSGGSAVATNNGVDPALAQLSAHQATLAQQAASQGSQNSFTLALDAQQAAENLAALRVSAQTSTTHQANEINGQLAIAQMVSAAQSHAADAAAVSAIQMAQISATTSAQQMASTVAVSSIAAHTQEIIASQNAHANEFIASQNTQVAAQQIAAGAAVATTQSNNFTAVALAQAQAQERIATTNSNNNARVATTSSDNNFFSSLVGGILSIF